MTAVDRALPSRRASSASAVMWFGLAVCYLLVLAYGMTVLSYDIWGALVLVPIFTVIIVPILRRAARKDPDPTIYRLLILAYVAKLIGTVIRYIVTFNVYAGSADAQGYHGAGMRIAAGFWDGRFSEAMEAEMPKLIGTSFMRLLTGLFYIVTGPTKLGGFLIFGFLSFLGMFWFYRACVIGFPDANHRRYAILLLFLPTLVYWPSSIGKEAWMIFTLGLTSYGVALILRHQPLGYLTAALGMTGTAMVRPHVTVLCFAALFVAYLLRRRSWSESRLGPIGKMVGVAVLLVAGGIVVGRAAAFFNLDDVDTESVDQVFERTESQSAQGGSEFTAARPTSPREFPNALLSVLFRPYPWEANNAQAMVAAIEGMMLLILFGVSVSRLVRVPVYVFRVPYVAYVLAFTVMFVLAFSSIGNFGTMTRQRAQVFPFVLVLLAIPPAEQLPGRHEPPTLERRMQELAARNATQRS